MSVADDFSRFFREAGVEPAAVQPEHLSGDTLLWIRQMSTQTYRDTKVQVSGILSAANEPSNVTRLGSPRDTGSVPTDSSLWPQSTLDQRNGKFIFRTLVERNFTTHEVAMLLIEAYYSKAQVNALLIGKRAVWRLVLMPLTQSGNRIVDAEMVNALQSIMSQVKRVVPTSENISRALRCTGYVQYIHLDSNDVPTPYLPRIATASGVAMAVGMVAAMFKYHRNRDGTTFMDAEPTQSAAFEEVTDERLNVPSSLRWDTVKPQISIPQQMQMVPSYGTDHAVYRTNLVVPAQNRPVLSFVKDAWGNIGNMIRVSHVAGLFRGGVEQGDLVWLGFNSRVDDHKFGTFRRQGAVDVRVIKAADEYKYFAEEGQSGLLLQPSFSGELEQDHVLALDDMPLFRASDGAVMAALPTSLGAQYLDAVEISRPTKNKIIRLKRFVGTKYADRAPEVVQYTPSPGQNADIRDIVYQLPSQEHIGTLQLVKYTEAPGMFFRSSPFMLVERAAGKDHLTINGVRIFGAPDGNYMARLDTGFVAITPPRGGRVDEGDLLTVNGMALFQAPDRRVMAALPSTPEAPTFNAVEVRHLAEGGFTEPVKLSNVGYVAPTFKPVKNTGVAVPSLAKFERLADTGREAIIWQEIPYTVHAVRGDDRDMLQLIAAVDRETTEDTYKATSTQLSGFSGLTHRLTAGVATAVQSAMAFVGGPDATYDTFTQPESLQTIMHDISPIAWVVSSLREAIAPPPSEADVAAAAAWIERFSQSGDSIGMLESMILESMGPEHLEIAGLITKPQMTNAIAPLGRLDLPAMVSTQAQMLDQRLRTTLSGGLPREQNSREEIMQLIAREVKQSATVIKYTVMSEKSVLLVEKWRDNFESGNGVTVQDMEEIVHRDLLDNMDYYREEFELQPMTSQVLVMTKEVTAAFARGATEALAALPVRVANFCHQTDAALDISVTVAGWYAKGLDGVVNLWESAASSSQALGADLLNYAHHAWQKPGQAPTNEALPPRQRRALLTFLKVVHNTAFEQLLDAGSSAWQQRVNTLTDGYNTLPPQGRRLVLGYLKTLHGMSVKVEQASAGAAAVWRDLKSLYSVGIFPEPDQVLSLMRDLGPKGLMDAHNEAMQKPTGDVADAGIIRACLVSLGLESAYDKHVGPVVSTVISYVPTHPRWEERRAAALKWKRLYYDIWDVFEHPFVVGLALDHMSSMSLDSAVELLHRAWSLSPKLEASNYPSRHAYGLALFYEVAYPKHDGPRPPPMGPHLPHTYVHRPPLPAELRPVLAPPVNVIT